MPCCLLQDQYITLSVPIAIKKSNSRKLVTILIRSINTVACSVMIPILLVIYPKPTGRCLALYDSRETRHTITTLKNEIK